MRNVVGLGRVLLLTGGLIPALLIAGCGSKPESKVTPTTEAAAAAATLEVSHDVPPSPTANPTPSNLTGIPNGVSNPLPQSHDTPVVTSSGAQISEVRPTARVAANLSVGPAPFNVQFKAFDADASLIRWNFGDGGSEAISSSDDSVTHEYTKAGAYEVTVSTTTGGDAKMTVIAKTQVIVEAGLLDRVTIQPATLNLTVNQEHQFIATDYDVYGNTISGLSHTFRADATAGQVDNLGKFQAGTVAGYYPAAVTVEVTQGTVTKSTSADLTLGPGPLDQVLLSPRSAVLEIGQSQQFNATAVDAYGNPLPNARITWTADKDIGTVTESGLLTVISRAGTSKKGVTAAILSIEAIASITIKPGPPAKLNVPDVVIGAGDTTELVAIVEDQHGNRVEGVNVTWSLEDRNAGSLDLPSLLAAGEVARRYRNAIQATVQPGNLTTLVDVTVVPKSLDRVVIAPATSEIGIQMIQQFVAKGVDRFGNPIPGLDIDWNLAQNIGSLDGDGLFISGAKPGFFEGAIEAVATQGGLVRSATSRVEIEPDRIAFISDRIDARLDIYVMDIDGGNVRRVTTGATPSMFSWSPDGRRIVSDFGFFSNRFIVATNDDGTWDVLLTPGGMDSEPAWSPDGQKVAFVSTVDGNPEIYVMDIDGSNVTRITNDPDVDQNPSWSPDSKQIAFTSDRDGNLDIHVVNLADKAVTQLTTLFGHDTHPSWSPDGTEIVFRSDNDGDWDIYLMHADGGNIRKLTSNRIDDVSPSWSLDGQRILFASGARFEDWEIYSMSRSGGDVIQFTNNEELDLMPQWAPRKRGVAVSEASLVIPDASTLVLLNQDELVAKAGAAIVRIETGFGSGSGFVIDPEGLILTSNHVTKNTTAVTVRFKDGTTYDGTVIGRDLVRNLAVVRIGASGLSWLELGDTSRMSAGAELLLITAPQGASGLAVTTGSLSAMVQDTGRNILWMQINLPLRERDAGAPLLSLQGEVVGVVDSKSFDAGVEDVNLAVSVNTIKLYLERLKGGEVIAG